LRFHYDTGSFKSKADVLLLFDKLRELIDHFELQAEAGVKFRFGGNPLTSTVDYNMFVNELILGDNTAFFETDHMRLTFLNHSVLYFVYTRDERFNNRMYENIQNLINKSTMISKVGEKERTGFFNHLREEIDKRRWEIEG
jgi:hypothetical protein